MHDTESQVVGIIVAYRADPDALKRLSVRLAPALRAILIMNNTEPGDARTNLSDLDFGPTVHVKELGGNLGIATAQNMGIRLAAGMGATSVLLLDDDSGFPPEGVDILTSRLSEERKRDPRVVGIGPRVVDHRTGKTIAARWIDGSIVPCSIEDTTQVAYLVSSGSLISIAAFEKFGYFREDYFIDHVDQEWGLRVGSCGGVLLATPDVTMMHQLGDEPTRSARGATRYRHDSPVREYYLTRNALLMWRDLESLGRRRQRILSRVLKTATWKVFLPGRSLRIRAAVLRGLFDGATNVRGRYGQRGSRQST